MAASFVARRIESRPVQIAAILDMTVTVTALYYWMVVRRGLRPRSSLILVVALGLMRASFAFPGVVPGRLWIVVAAECSVLFFAREIIVGELAVFYYAFAWWARPQVPAGAEPFTLHKRTGFADLLLCLGLASLFEIVLVHLILSHRWNHTAAWVATGVSLYGALWCVALARSLALRPTFVGLREAEIRFGMLLTLKVPGGSIKSIGQEAAPGVRTIPRSSEPNVCLTFGQPLEARWIFGIRRPMEAISLAADDPEGLTAALRRMAY
jgi:hypothetical protein